MIRGLREVRRAPSLDERSILNWGSNVAFPKARPLAIGGKKSGQEGFFHSLTLVLERALWSSKRHKGSRNGINKVVSPAFIRFDKGYGARTV